MSVFDATAIDMAARTPGGTKEPGAGGEKPPVKEDAVAASAKKDDTADGRPATSEVIDTLLEKHGIANPEELGALLEDAVGLKSRLGDADLEELMKSHETLQAYRKDWAEQEREKLKENETPEETIKRLERELTEQNAQAAKGEQKRKQAQDAQRHITEFNTIVKTGIEKDEGIPEEYRGVLAFLMGVKNPINDVDIRDKAAVLKTLKWGSKIIKDFEQTVIKRYRAGKGELVETPAPSSSGAPVPGEKKVANLTEARRLAHESLGALRK